MRRELRRFADWLGIWTGHGKLARSKPGYLRLHIRSRLGGDCLELNAENVLDDSQELLAGGVALLCAAEDDRVQMMSYSTSYGVMLLQESPDDPGVLALEGTNLLGIRMSVTMVVDGDEMVMTTVVRKHGDEEPVTRTAMKLKRLKVRYPGEEAAADSGDEFGTGEYEAPRTTKKLRHGTKERTSKIRPVAGRMDGKR